MEKPVVSRQELNNILWKLLQEGATLPLTVIFERTVFISHEGDEEHGTYSLIVGSATDVISRARARSEIHTLAIRMFEALPRRIQGEGR